MDGETDPEILGRVLKDNQDANLFGPGHEEDGVSDEVAADLGFTDPDTLVAEVGHELAERQPTRRETVAKPAGKVVCGDCGIEMPCGQHEQYQRGRGHPGRKRHH